MPAKYYYRTRKKRILFIMKSLLIFAMLYSGQYLLTSFARYYFGNGLHPLFGIAKWDVSVDNTLSNHSLNLVCGGSGENYTFSVESESEVAVSYNVVLTSVPDDVQVSLDGGSYDTPTNNSITFQNVGTFGVNDVLREHEHTLTFKAPLEATVPSVNTVTVEVRFSQVI